MSKNSKTPRVVEQPVKKALRVYGHGKPPRPTTHHCG